MKNLLFKLSAIAVLAYGQGSMSVLADDVEEKAAVPRTGNGEDAESEIYRASEVIGLTVKGDDGSDAGKIKDLVINGATREVLYAVVAMNQAKEKNVVYVMPWTVFQPSYNQGQGNAILYATLTIPQTVWLQAPYFPVAQWRQTPYTQWSPQVNKYYSTNAPAGSGGNNSPNRVQVNKPALGEDNGKRSTSQKPRGDTPKNNPQKTDEPRDDSPKNAPKNNEKPQANDPGRKPADQPKPRTETKPGENPAVQAPESSKPKAADPTDPKKPAPPKDSKPK